MEVVGKVLLCRDGVCLVMGVDVALAVTEAGGTGIAASPLMPVYAAFDFGASALWTTACARMIRASGMPICATACIAATAVWRALGSASPMSSDAAMTTRRAMNRGSSPASSIRAR